MKLIALLTALALTACATPRQTHDLSAAIAIAGITADAVTTYDALSGDCRESNPIFKNASNDSILLFNVALAGSVYYFRDYIPNEILWLTGIVKGGVAVHNASLDC